MNTIIAVVVLLLLVVAGVAIWFGMKAQKTQPSPREGDTAWNDKVSPGDEATRPQDD